MGADRARLDRGSDEYEGSLTGLPAAALSGVMAQMARAGIQRGCFSAMAEMAELASSARARFPGNLFEGAGVAPGLRTFPLRPAVVKYA